MGALKLDVFDDPRSAMQPAGPPVDAEAQEEARLASFEAGYGAGWDDAVAANEGEENRLRADLARNLQDLSFTYHEARSHVLRALEPLLTDLVGKVLPAMARETLGSLVLETIQPFAESLAGAPITVLVAPAARARVEQALAGAGGGGAGGTIPLRFVEEPTLDESQVSLRCGDQERRVDLGAVISAVQSAVAAYFHIETEQKRHG